MGKIESIEKRHKENMKDQPFAKSNTLIRAKYNASLLENKLIDICLYSLQHAERCDNGRLSTTIKACDLRDILDGNKGSFYTQLNAAAKRLPGLTLNVENPENEEFDIVTIFSRFQYARGTLTIEFNPRLEEYITDINKRFALISIDIIKQFKNNHSIRLYELLKSKAFSYDSQDTYIIRYNLADLRIDLNLVNLQCNSVARYLAQTKYPNNQKIVELAENDSVQGKGKKNNVMFKDWRDFKRYVLDSAEREINDISDISIGYEPVKGGTGGAVTDVEFTVRYKDITEKKLLEKTKNTAATDAATLVQAADIIQEALPMNDIRTLVKAADGDLGKLKKAVDVMNACGNRVENITGFLLSAMKNNYSKRENPFTVYEQNSYDFDGLEAEILAN